MQIVKLAMKSSENYPMKGNVQVDEFVVERKETEKQGWNFDVKKSTVTCAIELTDDGTIKRGYANVINNYSAKSTEPLFDTHIDKDAKINTINVESIKSLQKTIILSKKKYSRKKIKKMHIEIKQIKSELINIQTHVKKEYLQKYLDEYFYRLNRSIYKETIVDNLLKRLVNHNQCGLNQIIVFT